MPSAIGNFLGSGWSANLLPPIGWPTSILFSASPGGRGVRIKHSVSQFVSLLVLLPISFLCFSKIRIPPLCILFSVISFAFHIDFNNVPLEGPSDSINILWAKARARNTVVLHPEAHIGAPADNNPVTASNTGPLNPKGPLNYKGASPTPTSRHRATVANIWGESNSSQTSRAYDTNASRE